VLSAAEYAAGQRSPAVASANYGKVVERLTALEVQGSTLHSRLFEYVSGPYQPDFIGRPGSFAEGMNFDITTPRQISAHLVRPGYGLGLNVVTYDRPRTFRLFPEARPR
jgi:hypothetical protein